MDDQQLIQTLLDELKKLTASREQQRKKDLAVKELETLQKKLPLTTKERELLIVQLKVAKDLLKADKERVEQLEETIKGQEKVNKANEDMVDILERVGNSFLGLGKAAFEGQGSISAFTDNVFGLQTLGNRLDVNIETFRQLSQTGANFGQSIVALRTAAADAALPLDDFASLVASNSQNLAALFGSTTQGAQRIAELGRVTREVGIERLAPLGLTVDEINETLLLNLDSQRRTGILGRLTDQQRIDSAINFAEQLDRLAKLTGQQRDELRAQIEQQQSNERFQAALQGQTDATRQRLQAFAGTVAGISPDLAEGFQDLIANAGVPVTESALALVQNIPGARDVINDLISGVVSSEQALVRIRDISAGSVDRFRQATITGQVEFLRLQGGIINLGRRITDVGAVTDEQNKSATSLVSNLTTFEQATKVLSSQFQSIETGLLKAFGPALGGLIGGIQGIMGGTGGIAVALAKAPYLTATLFTGALAGKFLFNKAAQIGIIAAGTSIGTQGLGKTLGSIGRGFGPGGAIRGAGGVLGKVGLGGVGAAGLAVSGGLASSDEPLERLAGVAGSAASGALLGSVIPGVGTTVGAVLGGLYGLVKASGAMQFGGNMDAGKTFLVGESGPEMITSGTKSTVTANQDLKDTFDTTALETKMASMTTELNNANKALTSMVNGVNTLVAVESRALKAVETTARKDRNQVGLV
jgi:DNA-binding transcriptional MerR regulator